MFLIRIPFSFHMKRYRFSIIAIWNKTKVLYEITNKVYGRMSYDHKWTMEFYTITISHKSSLRASAIIILIT